MDADPAMPASEPDDAPLQGDGEAAERALIVLQQAQLKRMAEIGMEVLEAIGREASAAPAPAPAVSSADAAPARLFGDLDLAFARASRAVRLTHALQLKLLDQLESLESGARVHAIIRAGEARAARDTQVERLETIVGRIASVDHEHDDAGVDRIVEEAAERLDDEDVYGDLVSRPFSEIVDQICRDLGLSPDWPRLAGEYWALDEIQSGRVGEPLANLAARTPAPPPRAAPHAVTRPRAEPAAHPDPSPPPPAGEGDRGACPERRRRRRRGAGEGAQDPPSGPQPPGPEPRPVEYVPPKRAKPPDGWFKPQW